jgi:CHASE1-domain containing sensor protein
VAAADEPTRRAATPGSGSASRRSLRVASLIAWREHPAALVVLLVGLALSVGAFLVMLGRERQASRIAFERRAQRTAASFRANLERPLEVLRTLPALFEASDEVTRGEFKHFVRAALDRHRDIFALGWMPRVRAPERMIFEEAGRAQGLAAFEITELRGEEWVRAGDRPEYFPILYVEPHFPRFLGYDEASEPSRAEALARARDTGAPAASRRITLLGDSTKGPGVIVFVPIYVRGGVPESVPARRDRLRGCVVEVFRFSSVFEGLRKIEDLRGLELRLSDTTEPGRSDVLYETRDEAPAASGSELETTTVPLPFAGRTWSLALVGPTQVGAAPYVVLGLGGVLSLLFGVGTAAIGTILRLRRRMQAALKLGPFTLVEKIGEGGMGVVYKATHAMLKRPTAVKLLRLGHENDAMLRRFEREVQLTSSLAHPNTIAIYDYDRTRDGVFYYAMEYIDGVTLEDLVERKGALPPGRVVRVLKQVAAALAEAHSIGLIHRDIKPANVMISRRGGISDFVKVLDFGLVRTVAPGGDEASAPTLTHATALVGTPLYLAPEAITRPLEVDARADLYALGAVAYFLLTGQPPFQGTSIVEICGHHLHSAPEVPSARALGSVPAELDAVVLRCLEKLPEQRYQSAREVLSALEALAGTLVWSESEAAAWWETEGDALVLALRAETASRVSDALTVGGA